MNIDPEVAHLTALGGDGDDTLGCTRTVEHYGSSPFQQRDLVYFVGKHIVRVAHHTVHNHQIFVVSPDIAVETTYHIVNQAQTVVCICLFRHFLHVNDRHSTQQVVGVDGTECHLHLLERISLGGFHQVGQRLLGGNVCVGKSQSRTEYKSFIYMFHFL